MEFRVLGPFEVRADGEALALRGGKARALLALLLMNTNRVVSRERIVAELWDEAPASAPKMVQILVSELRKALPDLPLETRGRGYSIGVSAGDVDAERFRRVHADAREALAHGESERALELLDEALALWRGDALGEFDEPFAAGERARLEELRVAAIEDRAEALLALGRHRELVPELEPVLARQPMRERLVEQQLVALYRSGRLAEALDTYQQFRRRLNDELGLAPSDRLRDLERQMLRQDPVLRGDLAAAVPQPAPHVDVRYARSGNVSIAYQVVGSGELDIVLVHGWICSFAPGWEDARISRFYRRIAEMGRLILFDKRGTGMSDRVPDDRLPDLETRMDDVRAVMDAVGSHRALLVGVSEGGAMSALFAATYPQRTFALGLISSFARTLWAPDYEIGFPEEMYRARMRIPEDHRWATQTTREWLSRVAPNVLNDAERFRWYTSYLARGASPGATRALRTMNMQIDARDVLPAIRIPTLVLCRQSEFYNPMTVDLARRIPGARLVELPGDQHLPWEGDQDQVIAEIAHFVASVRDEVRLERVLVTVLFTDLVGSTRKAAELGDRAWRDLVERHHAVVRAQLARFRGREVDTAGDGVFATFDGPARAVRCAFAIRHELGALGLDVRAGVHTGEIELSNGQARGIAVHIGARVAAAAAPGEVLVSRTVKDIVAGSGLEFDERGEHELAGVPGRWSLFAARG